MHFIVYTDGACSGNPGPGACASFIIDENGDTDTVTQAYIKTTNNRMELMAVIQSFDKIPSGSNVSIISDSTYVVDAINKNWLVKWKAKAFNKRLNKDLWELLILLLELYNCKFTWVRGHDVNEHNIYVDKLAKETIGDNPIKDNYYESTN